MVGGSMAPISDELMEELANQLNKLINIPFLNEDQERFVLIFLLKILANKLGLLPQLEKLLDKP